MPDPADTLLRDTAAACATGTHLDDSAVPALVEALLAATVPADSKAAFLRALTAKGETPAELAAFARALLPRAVDPGVHESWNNIPLFDCCGTGGGGLNLVNISTAIVFILAAGGVPVVKHGNKGVTKTSGSADVLAALGIRAGGPDDVLPSLEKIGAAFLFAPAFHPAFKEIAPVRQQLAKEGRRTIFNLLGPLLNPTRPATQIMGVFKAEFLDLFPPVFDQLDRRRHLTVLGVDPAGHPLGEASVFGTTRWSGRIEELPAAAAMEPPFPLIGLEELMVDSSTSSAAMIEDGLRGRGPAALAPMLEFNAGLAFWVHGTDTSLSDGTARARELLSSGAAAAKLDAWRSLSV